MQNSSQVNQQPTQKKPPKILGSFALYLIKKSTNFIWIVIDTLSYRSKKIADIYNQFICKEYYTEYEKLGIIKQNKILGAGLDVFHQEPLNIENPLLYLDNVVLSPHIGSATTETREKMVEIVIRNIKAHLKGENPPNLVIKE